MRIVQFLQKIATLVLMAYIFGPASAFAHVPRPREVQGVIRSIDYQKQTLVLDYGRNLGPRIFAWKSNTSFSCAGKSVLAGSLKPGVTVMVYYQSPFFGKSFATKVISLE